MKVTDGALLELDDEPSPETTLVAGRIRVASLLSSIMTKSTRASSPTARLPSSRVVALTAKVMPPMIQLSA